MCDVCVIVIFKIEENRGMENENLYQSNTRRKKRKYPALGIQTPLQINQPREKNATRLFVLI